MINTEAEPLVSVIVPCYNHGHYLSKAIESIRAQTYRNVEIIVVDDGSSDNTKDIAEKYDAVKYVFQHNQGLSAARNTGIDHSNGAYLVFLDSDDWLLPDALMINLKFLQESPGTAFVFGRYNLFFAQDQSAFEVNNTATTNLYCHLLERNFIAMIAAVMFQRWVFDSYRYDVSLRVCEDYDIYLRITREHPAIQHSELIAMYFIHDSNISKNSANMLAIALQVLNTQENELRNAEERRWFKRGQVYWRKFYCDIMYKDIINTFKENIKSNKLTLNKLKKEDPWMFFKLRIKLFSNLLKL